MIKKIITILCIIILLCVTTYYIYKKTTVNIKLETESISHIKITGFGSISLDTDDKTKINTILEYLRSMKCYKNKKHKVHNNSPDINLIMYDENGTIIDRLEIYGDLAEYKGNQYKVFFMSYSNFEKLCKKLNDIK